MNWLPPEPEHTHVAGEPWPGLAHPDPASLAYVVVDEIVAGWVGLAVSSWPTVDERGRLRFRGGRRLVAARAEKLQSHLDAHRVPSELRSRPLRVGDVFAVVPPRWPLPDDLGDDPAQWMGDEVHDVTAAARLAARASFFGTVAPRLDRRRDPDRRVLELSVEPCDDDSEMPPVGPEGAR